MLEVIDRLAPQADETEAIKSLYRCPRCKRVVVLGIVPTVVACLHCGRVMKPVKEEPAA